MARHSKDKQFPECIFNKIGGVPREPFRRDFFGNCTVNRADPSCCQAFVNQIVQTGGEQDITKMKRNFPFHGRTFIRRSLWERTRQRRQNNK